MVGRGGGRRQGTTQGGGRPEGTTLEAGFQVSESGGRPEGTTREAGCAVSKGRPHGKQRCVLFHPEIDLSQLWEHPPPFVSVDEYLLKACSRRICQQRTYDKKPLGIAVCYRCGHMLWSCVDGAHTFLVSKPCGMSEDDEPASAYVLCLIVVLGLYTRRGVNPPKSVGTVVLIASQAVSLPTNM